MGRRVLGVDEEKEHGGALLFRVILFQRQAKAAGGAGTSSVRGVTTCSTPLLPTSYARSYHYLLTTTC